MLKGLISWLTMAMTALGSLVADVQVDALNKAVAEEVADYEIASGIDYGAMYVAAGWINFGQEILYLTLAPVDKSQGQETVTFDVALRLGMFPSTDSDDPRGVVNLDTDLQRQVVSSVPIPNTILLLGAGLLGIRAIRKKLSVH